METALWPAPEECIIQNQRDVNATIETVYKAITNPQYLKNWWGPKGFTNTFHAYDFYPGGTWDFTMHSPEGHDYANLCVFVKIEAPHLLVFNHVSPPEFQVVIRLGAITPERTSFTFTQVFETAEACGKLRDFCLEKNEENIDRLEVELGKM